ncbi:MAG: hypothetical protein ACP5QG_01685 [candidate division WOR-3 bacterium]
MREIEYQDIVNAVAEMCPEACMTLDEEMKGVMCRAMSAEESPLGQKILRRFIEVAPVPHSLLAPGNRLSMPCQQEGISGDIA